MKILLDAFGGDNAPQEAVIGAVLAVNQEKGFNVELVGKAQEIENILSSQKYDKSRITILNAEEVISCEEEPTVAIRKKPDSSICVAFKELKENEEAKAFVSAGSTGAVLVGATLKLGRIQGVNRPALCPELPTVVEGKKVFLLDAGANADCKPINLCQFAVMGSVYAKASGVENPKIALLSNGTEDEKGSALVHEVLPLLKKITGINFVGNCEARDILTGKYDVIVTDGFTGNVALKSLEGGISSILKLVKQGVYSSLKGKIGGMLLKDTFGKIRAEMDYNNQGGAMFIGVNKPVLKAHGSSDRVAIRNTLLQAARYAKLDMSSKIKEQIDQANGQIEVIG